MPTHFLPDLIPSVKTAMAGAVLLIRASRFPGPLLLRTLEGDDPLTHFVTNV